jgi:hypothetical protein
MPGWASCSTSASLPDAGPGIGDLGRMARPRESGCDRSAQPGRRAVRADEPSIGLHQRDKSTGCLDTLLRLRDLATR